MPEDSALHSDRCGNLKFNKVCYFCCLLGYDAVQSVLKMVVSDFPLCWYTFTSQQTEYLRVSGDGASNRTSNVLQALGAANESKKL
jgi:hypothetical protein